MSLFKKKKKMTDKLLVARFMKKRGIITVQEDCTLEEALNWINSNEKHYIAFDSYITGCSKRFNGMYYYYKISIQRDGSIFNFHSSSIDLDEEMEPKWVLFQLPEFPKGEEKK